jgi:predicted ATPase/DNA-binding winged helix-turn-helix (wHTH) protein
MQAYRFGDFELRPLARTLLLQGQPQALGARAFDLLLCLVRRAGALVGKAELLDAAWPGLDVEEANIAVQVSGLRKVLGATAIATVPGLGYRLALPVVPVPWPDDAAADAPVSSTVSVSATVSASVFAFAGAAAGAADPAGVDAAAGAARATPPPAPAPAPAPAHGAASLPPVPAAWAQPADALIGRADELHGLRRALAESRLLTMLGPGGIGKTSLARALERELANELPDERAGGQAGGHAGEPAGEPVSGPAAVPGPLAGAAVAWVDLGALGTVAHVAGAVATAARVQLDDAAGGSGDPLARALAGRRLLLVLDNCEHLAAALGPWLHALLAALPALRVLATSQAPLQLAGERLWRVTALAGPPPGLPLARWHECPAVQLLMQRLQQQGRRLVLTPANAAAMADLLQRLDGLPLAIEMAAARLPLLGPQALCERLAEGLALLRKTQHGVPARQQTLLATLAWSHSLLTPHEQAVLRRLACFAGSFGLDAAEAVGALGATSADERVAVIDALASLVDKSLVQTVAADPPRYRLPETMRLFASEQRRAAGEDASAAQAHGQAMVALARRLEDDYWALGDAPWLARYASDYDDLQAAFDRALNAGAAALAAHTGHALHRLDALRSVNAPRRRRAEQLHALLPQADAASRALIWSCLTAHGLTALRAVPRLEAARQAVLAWRALGDAPRLHFALGFLASELARAGEHDAADAALAEALALQTPRWPLRRRLWAASAQSGVCIHRGDAAGYRQASRAELALAEAAGAERAAAWARLKLADAALMAGAPAEAAELGAHAVQQLRTLDQPSNLGLALSNLCAARLELGDAGAALGAALEALPLMARNGWAYLLYDSVAVLAALGGQAATAAQLLDFVDDWYRRHGDARQPNELRLAQRARLALASPPSQGVVPDAGAPRAAPEAVSLPAASMSDEQAESLALQVLQTLQALQLAQAVQAAQAVKTVQTVQTQGPSFAIQSAAKQ